MIPLYILGLLQRFGPQHGYQIKKTIGDELSDFTQMKLPTIYYHLEKMEAQGLLTAVRDKPGSRPEKTIYGVTKEGEAAFSKMLFELLDFQYRPSFEADGVFYFADCLDRAEIIKSLEAYAHKLQETVRHIEAHLQEALCLVPDADKPMAQIIFSHHLRHYEAELEWATESLQAMKGAQSHD